MNLGVKNYAPGQYFVHPSDKYDLPTTINQISQEILPTSFLPTEGDTIICYNNRVKMVLGGLMGIGGEGAIYHVNKALVCKIYKTEKLTVSKMEKLRLMISKPISDPEICWPIDIVTNIKGEPVGYIMPMAKGFILNRVSSQAFLQQYFPKWRRKDLVELVLTITSKIKYLHDRNAIIGDINTRNIMFVSPSEVYFVDTDSYQIEGFPCPVGTNEFTCKEILNSGSRFPGFLRNWGHENFSIAMLFFVLLMNGRHPYSYKGGEDTVSNIKKSFFPYPYDTDTQFIDQIPAGNWRLLWQYMPEYVKGAFYSTFSFRGNHNENKTRMGSESWVIILYQYLDTLTRERKTSLSNELFPGLPPIPKTIIKKTKSKVTMKTSVYDNSLDKYNTRKRK